MQDLTLNTESEGASKAHHVLGLVHARSACKDPPLLQVEAVGREHENDCRPATAHVRPLRPLVE